MVQADGDPQFYIDKTGRRPLLIYGALAMGACHFVVGGILSTGEYVPGGVGGNPKYQAFSYPEIVLRLTIIA